MTARAASGSQGGQHAGECLILAITLTSDMESQRDVISGGGLSKPDAIIDLDAELN